MHPKNVKKCYERIPRPNECVNRRRMFRRQPRKRHLRPSNDSNGTDHHHENENDGVPTKFGERVCNVSARVDELMKRGHFSAKRTRGIVSVLGPSSGKFLPFELNSSHKAANARANSAPMPVDAPVIRIPFPENSGIEIVESGIEMLLIDHTGDCRTNLNGRFAWPDWSTSMVSPL